MKSQKQADLVVGQTIDYVIHHDSEVLFFKLVLAREVGKDLASLEVLVSERLTAVAFFHRHQFAEVVLGPH